MSSITFANISDLEVVHQRCVLISGSLSGPVDPSKTALEVLTLGENGAYVFPKQYWPISDGHFKALVILTPGKNSLVFSLGDESKVRPSHGILFAFHHA